MSWLMPPTKAELDERRSAGKRRFKAQQLPRGPQSEHDLGADFLPGAMESHNHWQVIWPRIIALAWEDKEFHKELKADPHKAINEAFGYKLSPSLKLKIEDAPAGATYDADADYPNDPWSKLPDLELTIALPPAPPADIQAIAITAYQDTGRTYPFTCC